MRFHHLPKLTTITLALFFGLALILPAPFTMIMPSKAQAVYPRLLSYQDKALGKSPNGNFYLLSIAISDPDAPLPGLTYLAGWVRGDIAVIPRSVLFPDNKDFKTIEAENRKEMKASQNVAATYALDYVQRKFPKNFTQKKPTYRAVAFDVRNTGGPSAGLVFALSLTELLTQEDLLQGRKIAATGTISKGGYVGIIGGLQEKLISVARAGVTTVLIPRDNCADISRVPGGITVIPVVTLDEAVEVLLGRQAAKSCTNLAP